MEIRKFSDIIGIMVVQDVVEGRFVMLTPAHADTSPYTLYEDLAGARLPTDADEAAKAKYVLGWAYDNRPTPIFVPYPAYNWILRNYGFESGVSDPSGRNLPMTSQTVYLTTPSVQEGLTIPSGSKALAFAGGVYTFPSGHFVDSANIQVVGNTVAVTHTAGDDRGKPYYSTTGTVGVVEQFDSTAYSVTIRTLQP